MPAKATACRTCGTPDLIQGRAFCRSCYNTHQRTVRYPGEREARLAYARERHLVTLQAQRARALERKYGLSWETYAAMLEAQGNACAICLRGFGTGKREGPYADHCHTQGHVRGLLCQACNLGLGMFRDDPDALRRAADYLA